MRVPNILRGRRFAVRLGAFVLAALLVKACAQAVLPITVRVDPDDLVPQFHPLR